MTSFGIEFQTEEEAKENERSPSVALLCAGLLRRGMVFELERVLRECYGFLCSMPVTYDIIWNRVPDRRRSKRKWTITKCCLTVCRSIEKRHGVWAGASVAGVQWLSMQHASDIWWCSTDVAVVAQTSYFVRASYFDRKPMKRFYVYAYTRWLWKAHDYSSCIVLYPLQVGCYIICRTKQQWATVVNSWQYKSR